MPTKIVTLKNTVAILAFSFLLFSVHGYADDKLEKITVKGKQEFTECAAIRMKEITLKHLQDNPEKHTTKVPIGWTVVSGNGGQGHPKLLICR